LLIARLRLAGAEEARQKVPTDEVRSFFANLALDD